MNDQQQSGGPAPANNDLKEIAAELERDFLPPKDTDLPLSAEKRACARASNPKALGPKGVSFSHEALVFWLLANPEKDLRDCALYFGYSQAWISCIVHSDAFRERYKEQQDKLASQLGVDILGRLQSAADIALAGLTRKLEEAENPEFLLDATDKLLNRLGYAPKAQPLGVVVNNTNAVNVNVSVDPGLLQAAREKMVEHSERLALVPPKTNE